MTYDLSVLEKNRKALLLAEAVGWLHDYRKCSEEHLQAHGAAGGSQQARPQSPTALLNAQLALLGSTDDLRTLLDHWSGRRRPESPSKNLMCLSRCHNTAHVDKRDPRAGQQNHPAQISSPLGYERPMPQELTTRLATEIPWNDLNTYSECGRDALRQAVERLFGQASADTRRPINEISLWSWGWLVGSLYKAALARALLLVPPRLELADLRWRFLSVRCDALTFVTGTVRLTDLLARRELLRNSLDRVRNLLEVTYPLGSEVYRDENGSVFVVPDLDGLLDARGPIEVQTKCAATLRMLVLRAFSEGTIEHKPHLCLGGELLPNVTLDPHSWRGQDPDTHQGDDIPSMGEVLGMGVAYEVEPSSFAKAWPRGAEICPVCGIRPQSGAKKAGERKVCDICEQRRLDRSSLWASTPQSDTIWLDEVADVSGRLALIAGSFDLTHWVSGHLVTSLLNDFATDSKPAEGKAPSFSRISRVWQTTQRFWLDVRDTVLDRALADDRRRLLLWPRGHLDAGAFHVYGLALTPTVTLDVVWYPPRHEEGGYLISAGNLCRAARELGAAGEIHRSPAAAAIWVQDWIDDHIVRPGAPAVLQDPDAGAGAKAETFAEVGIVRTDHQDRRYATAIPILAEPRTFMTLVPADRALDVVRAIKAKYEREMGKVRNRLPMHLGIVYANRRTPLRAVLDAGRRLLDYDCPAAQPWSVTAVADAGGPPDDLGADPHFAAWRQVRLSRGSRVATWRVPLTMGDGATTDEWYPYVYLATDAEPTERPSRFRAPCPWAGGSERWMVHARDLRPEDEVYFTPATLDWVWLDSAARRFEIAYDDAGQRRGQGVSARKPYLLDDLGDLDDIWTTLSTKLSTAQIYALCESVEARREAWQPTADDPVFLQFCRDAVANAQWTTPPWDSTHPRSAWLDTWQHYAARGWLTDVVQVRMQVQKENVGTPAQQEAHA